MHIIITGATGFVGQNLSTYFKKQGILVDELSLRNENWSLKQNADALIHLAGKAHDTENSSLENEYFKVNTDLTIKLFDEFLSSNIKLFIYFSSVKATADTVNGTLTEENPSKPLTPYGKSKLKAEEYLLSKILPEDKKVIIVRPCMIHGPGNKGNLNLLFQVVRKNLPWPLATFHNSRSFLGIDNLIFLITKILECKEIKSGIYNFADDEVLSTNDLVKIIAQTLNKKERLWKLNNKVVLAFTRMGDALRLPLNSERLKKLTESYIVSNNKIKSVLEIQKLPYTAEEGMVRTIRSFLSKD